MPASSTRPSARFLLLLSLAIAPAVDARAQGAPPPVSAADRETARGLFDRGVQAEQRGDLASAEALFRDANKLVHVPSTALFLARVLAKQGRLLEARDHALEATRAPVQKGEDPFQARCRAEAVALASDLEGRIPSLTIRLVGGDRTTTTLTIDGAPAPVLQTDAPRKLNPGSHTIVATSPGLPPTSVTVTLAEREAKEVVLALGAAQAVTPPPPPPPPRKAPKTLGPILLMAGGFGLGGASLIAGAVTGGLALSKTSELREQCGGPCPPSLQDEFDAASTLATASDVTFIVGGALVLAGAGGLIWYAITTKGSNTRTGLSFGVAPTSASLRWDF
jgi:hypothetical protein